MNSCFVDYLFYKHTFPMLMGEKPKSKDLDAVYKEFGKRKIFTRISLPLLVTNQDYNLIGLTNECAEKIHVGGASLVDLYRKKGVQVQFPKAPCMILQNEANGELVLALIDQCLQSKCA